MKTLLALAPILVFSLLLAACGGQPQAAPDPDVVSLAALEKQAVKVAQTETPDPILHQVDTDLHWTVFRFTDQAATKEITVLITAPDVPMEQWHVEVNTFSKLVGSKAPGIDLQTLNLGPGRVSRAAAAQWPGCTLHSLTLFLENETLTWVAFCGTSTGLMSGFMKNDGGIFQTYPGSPAQVPVTATPAR